MCLWAFFHVNKYSHRFMYSTWILHSIPLLGYSTLTSRKGNSFQLSALKLLSGNQKLLFGAFVDNPVVCICLYLFYCFLWQIPKVKNDQVKGFVYFKVILCICQIDSFPEKSMNTQLTHYKSFHLLTIQWEITHKMAICFFILCIIYCWRNVKGYFCSKEGTTHPKSPTHLGPFCCRCFFMHKYTEHLYIILDK